MSLKTILVVDDEQPTLRMFQLLLKAYGFTVLTAQNGVEGLELFKEHRPSLVLTDIKMPKMDGIDLLKNIKKIDKHAEIIIITGHGDMDLAIQALNLDATDFIDKPINQEALSEALSRAEERLSIARSASAQAFIIPHPEHLILKMQGNITASTVDVLEEVFEVIGKQPERTLYIQFDENASINGIGIAVLVDQLTLRKNNGGETRIAGLSKNFRTVFTMVGITQVATLCDDFDELGLK